MNSDPFTNLPYRSRLHSKTALAPDVWQLRFDTPSPAHGAMAPWQFTSGQYTTLGLPAHLEAPQRPYSIASAPHHDYVDLHIRDSGHGLSHAAITRLNIGDTVGLGAPAGSCVPAHAQDRPLLLLAGGVGIAPMVSIIGARTAQPCHLYWAVSDAAQLYLHDYWQTLATGGHLAAYHALVEHAAPTLPLRHGHIGPAVAHDLPDLSDFAIYLAGPAAMVAATVPVLTAHHAQKEYIFGDGITL